MQEFYKEVQDLIEEMRKDISALSEKPDAEILRRLFRYAHIIKSSSGSVGFGDLEKVTQALEEIFRAASSERLVISADVIPLLVESVEVCQKLLNGQKVASFEELLKRLNGILSV
ncbi:MAG: Hpt domain-containing protein [Thermodesulfobacteriota bacterium]